MDRCGLKLHGFLTQCGVLFQHNISLRGPMSHFMTCLQVQSIPMPGGFAEMKKKYGKFHLGINQSVPCVRCPNNCSCIYAPLCPEGVRRFLAAESDCYVYLAVYCQPRKHDTVLMAGWCWSTVCDFGLALKQHWVRGLYLLLEQDSYLYRFGLLLSALWRPPRGVSNKHWFNGGPASATLAQHWTNSGSMSCFC